MPFKFREGKYTRDLWKMVHLVGAYRHRDIAIMACDCDTREDFHRKKMSMAQAERRLRKNGYLDKVYLKKTWYVKRSKNAGMSEKYAYRGAEADYERAVRNFWKTGSTPSNKLVRGRRLAQAAMFAQASGCGIYPEEKPPLEGGCSGVCGNFFYTPFEIRNSGEDEIYGSRPSRAAGYITAASGNYAVYIVSGSDRYLDDTPEIHAERKAGHILEQMRRDKNGGCGALFVYESSALDYIMDQGGGLLDIYMGVYAVKLDFDGIRHARMILADADHLRNSIVDLSDEMYQESVIESDAYIKDSNIYLLAFFLPDVKRLQRFVRAAALNPDSRFEILCFDIQVEDLLYLRTNNLSLRHFCFEEAYAEWLEDGRSEDARTI